MSGSNGNPPDRKSWEETTYDGERTKPKKEKRLVAGKDPVTGKFLPGNQVFRNKLDPKRAAQQMRKLRVAAIKAVDEEDLTKIVRKMVSLAKAGNIRAAEFVYDRTLGKPVSPIQLSAQIQTDFPSDPIKELSTEELVALVRTPYLLEFDDTGKYVQERKIEDEEEETD